MRGQKKIAAQIGNGFVVAQVAKKEVSFLNEGGFYVTT